MTFFVFLEDEEEIPRNPMAKMTPPIVPEQPVDVLSDDELKKLLATRGRKRFEDVRVEAIIRLLVDNTGMRRAELLGLAVDDVDLDQDIAIVLGKGRRPRSCPFAKKTAMALDRYLRLRARHRCASDPRLWLGRRGRLGESSIGVLLNTRGEQAGIGPIHAHQLRHTFCPRLAGRRRKRGRPDVADRLAIALDAAALRGVHRSRACT